MLEVASGNVILEILRINAPSFLQLPKHTRENSDFKCSTLLYHLDIYQIKQRLLDPP